MGIRSWVAVSRCLAFAVVVTLVLSLSGCGATAPPDQPASAPKQQPPGLDADPRVAAAFYFDALRQFDGGESRSNAFWRVETDTTPTASAALAALAYMARRYSNQRRLIILETDVGEGPATGRRSPATWAYLVWNPTKAPVAVGLTPFDKAPPHSLSFYGFKDFAASNEPFIVSDVATEALSVDSPAHSRLRQRLREDLGLR